MGTQQIADTEWGLDGGLVRFPALRSLGWVFGAPPPEIDTEAPVVGNFVPPVGTPVTAQQPLQFDVTDNEGQFRRIIVHAVYADGVEEVVHNGESFRGLYATVSARVLITDGYRYTVKRSGGWPSTPRITIFAIDVAGNEAA